MNLLLDTHLILWLAAEPHKLSTEAFALIAEPENVISCSVVSFWEIAIKTALGRPDFAVNLPRLRKNLFDNGYRELAITGEHALALDTLPTLHKDPFDRMLVAQAMVEELVLLTSDATVASYGGSVRRV